MKRLAVIVASLFVAMSSVYGQNAGISGTVKDNYSKDPLEYACVMLLRQSDSVLQKFSRAGKDGNFTFQGVSRGKYLFIITHPTYADYVDVLELKEGEIKQLDTVHLLLKAKLLEDVVVRQTIAAMRMKGDTLEYTTDSFSVKSGATVEDLLKKLPGIQVDKDGKITAQGQRVEKVLIDGEEFFGDDPTIATQGLQADALDKVQVFDKKSDQAVFTGIDDGQLTKTLNLKLKEDKKKGYFGKVDVAAGNDDRWNNSVMVNVFKAKRKFSAYGIMSSTGKTGLDWTERNNYGSGTSYEYSEDGFYFSSGDDMDFGSYYGSGIPKSWTGGIHYSNKFNGDKQNINGSYRFNKLVTEGLSSTLTQSAIPGNLFYTRSSGRDFSNKIRHSMNGTYEFNIDSFTSVKLTMNGNVTENQNSSAYYSESFNEKGQPFNNSTRTSGSKGEGKVFNSSLLVKKRFKKAGRTASLNIDQQFNQREGLGLLKSVNNFYKEGVIDSIQLIDQQKVNNHRANGLTGKIAYTEPIVKNLFAEINYSLRLSSTHSEKLSFNADNTGKYANFDTTFSNSYNYDFLINGGGLSIKFSGKKITAMMGSDLAETRFRQKDNVHKQTLSRNFVNVFPKANFAFKFNANSRVSINYNGNSRQPSITQIQPVRDNNDPLNIAQGNPELGQEFRHNFSASYNAYKVLSQRGIYISGNFTTTDNAISMAQTIDSNRARTYQYINVNGIYSYSVWSHYSMKIKAIDSDIGIGLGVYGSRNVSYINSQQNITNNYSPNINYSISKHKEKKYGIGLWGRFSYNTASASINKTAEANYWTANLSPWLNITLPWKIEINMDAQIDLRQKTNVFDQNNNTSVVNGSLGRKILKNDKGIIKLACYDLFNQNRGIDRFINGNTITQNNNQVLAQYFTLNFIWNFSKTPAGMGPSED